MSILDSTTDFIPVGWFLTHLIRLNPDWQANISDGEYCTCATGDTIEDALVNASLKAFEGVYTGRIFDGISNQAYTESKITNLAALLRPKEPIKRRV